LEPTVVEVSGSRHSVLIVTLFIENQKTTIPNLSFLLLLLVHYTNIRLLLLNRSLAYSHHFPLFLSYFHIISFSSSISYHYHKLSLHEEFASRVRKVLTRVTELRYVHQLPSDIVEYVTVRCDTPYL